MNCLNTYKFHFGVNKLGHVALSKAKLSHNCHAGAKGEIGCRSYSFLTSALDGGEESSVLLNFSEMTSAKKNTSYAIPYQDN
jgi:hypothetical protein